MVKELYVSLDNAKLLKEKGFNETCRAYWGGFNDKPLFLSDCNGSKAFDYCDNRMLEKNYTDYDQTYIAAPTLQMAKDWIIDKYKLFITIDCIDFTEVGYIYSIKIVDMKTFKEYNLEYDYSPEEASNAAIKYCLENLI